MNLGKVIGKEVRGKLVDKIFTKVDVPVTAHALCLARDFNMPCQNKSCDGCQYFNFAHSKMRRK